MDSLENVSIPVDYYNLALISPALAPLIYTSSVINTPKKAISEINNTIQNIMWDGSTSKSHNKHLYKVYKMMA